MEETREGGPIEIGMQSVSSSNVSAIGYDAESQTLRVQFKNGGRYDYAEVEKEEFDDLRDAPSIGRHLNQAIKGQHGCTKIGG